MRRLASIGLVLVLGVGAGLAVAHADTGRGPALRTATAPSGFRAVTYHGLTVDVPRSWALAVGQPCRLQENTVVLPGVSAGCGQALQRVDTVAFYYGGLDQQYDSDRVVTSTVSGAVATRTYGRIDNLWVLDVAVPSVHASVVLETTTAAELTKLDASIRLVDVDLNGCSARGVPPVGAEAAGRQSDLLPVSVDQVSVCRYVAGYLAESAALSPRAANDLADVLNSLPAGQSSASGLSRPASCGAPGTDDEVYVVSAAYRHSRPVMVFARLGTCGALGATNGIRSGQRTDALAAVLTKAVGNEEGYPSEVAPVMTVQLRSRLQGETTIPTRRGAPLPISRPRP